jgi:hypothetical protein
VKLPDKASEQHVPAKEYMKKRQKIMGFIICFLHLFIDKKAWLS